MDVSDLGDFSRFVKKRKITSPEQQRQQHRLQQAGIQSNLQVQLQGGIEQLNITIDSELDGNHDQQQQQQLHENDSFKPGNIIKVEVTNFTTYSHGVYNLSSNLNMIIGPNGTGKSTLVSAICLGLGGKLDLIKRKSLKDMIKSGCERATIEITLMDHNFQKVTILRSFTDKETIWKLNNTQVKESQIKQMVKLLNIQLDNLCHFLPQERVAEFASLSPEKLLLETERTLGNGELAMQHERLISLDSDSCNYLQQIQQLEANLSQLLTQKSQLESEAKKYHQYEVKCQQISKHEKLIPYAQLLDLKNKTAHLKEARNQAKIKLKTFNSQLVPLKNQIDELKTSSLKFAQEFDQLDEQLKNKQVSINNLKQDLPKFNEVIKQLQSRIDVLKQKSSSKKQELDNLIIDHSKLMEKHKNLELPDENELKKLTELRNAKFAEINKIDQNLDNIKLDVDFQKQQLNDVDNSKQRLHSRLSSTDRLSFMELNNYDRSRINSLKAHKLLRRKPEFAGKYFECPIITCTIKDRRYAKFVERSIDNNTLLAITVVNDDDSHLIREYLKSEGLNVPIRRTNIKQIPHQPLKTTELKSLGFDGYVADFIDAPNEVLSMLYDTAKIHLTPVSLGDLTESQVHKLTSPTKNGSIIFAKFMARDTLYTVQRSGYGQRKTFYSTVRIVDSKYFTNSGISPQVRENLQNELKQLEQQEIEINQQLSNLGQQFKELRMSKEELSNESEGYRARRDELNKRKKEFTTIKSQLDIMAHRILKLKLDSRKDYTEKIRDTQNKMLEKYADNAKQMKQISLETSDIVKITYDMKISELRRLQAKNREINGIKLYEELSQRGKDLEQEYLQLKQQYDEIKKGDAAKKIAEQSLKYTDEEKVELSKLAKEYMDEGIFTESSLRNKIILLEQERDTLATADKNSIENLRQILHDIEYLEKALPRLKSKKELKDKEINDIRVLWEPKLKTLVNKISIAFSKRFTKVASDGQVELVTNDRFKDWRLHILVKFRQESDFSVLDSQSQSGGERAVSTIFFVMSLQGLTEAPFRVVDEINQGMDNKNEKMAHRYLVHSASKKGSSQYFLVTPKLLTGLYYSPKMKVHCIYTGPHLDIKVDNAQSLNFVDVNG